MTYYSTRDILVKGNKKKYNDEITMFSMNCWILLRTVHNEGKMQFQEINNPLDIYFKYKIIKVNSFLFIILNRNRFQNNNK